MDTRETIEAYFADLGAGGDWQRRFAGDVVFVSHGTPAKRVEGLGAFLESTRGFYGMIDGVELIDLLVDGRAACALTRYRLRPPVGDPFTSEIAEVLTVSDGGIDSLAIYFDSAPYPS
ncbi:MAG: nuclear transport factor 2 family protein [Deinococcales bacterium]